MRLEKQHGWVDKMRHESISDLKLASFLDWISHSIKTVKEVGKNDKGSVANCLWEWQCRSQYLWAVFEGRALSRALISFLSLLVYYNSLIDCSSKNMFGAVYPLDMHVQNSLIKMKLVFNVYLTFGTWNTWSSSATTKWGLLSSYVGFMPQLRYPNSCWLWGHCACN